MQIKTKTCVAGQEVETRGEKYNACITSTGSKCRIRVSNGRIHIVLFGHTRFQVIYVNSGKDSCPKFVDI